MFAVPGEVAGDRVRRPSVDRDAETDCAYRLVVAATTGTGDAGGGDRDVGVETASGAFGHCCGNLFAHRAVRGDHLGRYVEQIGLRVVGVRDDATGDIGRRPGAGGEPRSDEATGARLRSRDQPAVENVDQLVFDGGAVGREDLVSMVFGEDIEKTAVDVRVGGGESGHHVEFTASKTCGDLESVEVGDLCVGPAQCLCELCLVQSVGAHGFLLQVVGSGQYLGDCR